MSDRPSGYERWVGDAYRVPGIGSRPSPPRAWPVVVAACIATWLVLVRVSPLPEGWRALGAIALLVTGAILTLALLMSAFAVAERAHHALLARPSLGNWRIALWLGAFAGWLVACLLVAAVLLLVADA